MRPQKAQTMETFEWWVVRCAEWLLSQRSYELIIAPALADLEFEVEAGRRSDLRSRVALVRALAGGIGHEMMQGASGFLKLTLLSLCYYGFPVFVSVRLFQTWSDFFVAAACVLALSLVPVLVCFWPSRPVRQTE